MTFSVLGSSAAFFTSRLSVKSWGAGVAGLEFGGTLVARAAVANLQGIVVDELVDAKVVRSRVALRDLEINPVDGLVRLRLLVELDRAVDLESSGRLRV